MKYAIVCNNLVIEVVESETKPKYPNTEDGKLIIAVELKDDVLVCPGMNYSKKGFSGEYYEQRYSSLDEQNQNKEKTQLDVIQENTEKLLANESALDVLLGGVSE